MVWRRVSPRFVFLLLAVTSLGLVVAGRILGDVFQVPPCHLCNLQRLQYMLVAFFALGGLLMPVWRRVWSALLGLAAGGGAAAALQQSWMQYAPNEAIECGFGDPTLAEQLINWLGVQWPSMFMVTGFCTARDWVFLGLSLANWSALCFLGLFAVALWQFLRRD